MKKILIASLIVFCSSLFVKCSKDNNSSNALSSQRKTTNPYQFVGTEHNDYLNTIHTYASFSSWTSVEDAVDEIYNDIEYVETPNITDESEETVLEIIDDIVAYESSDDPISTYATELVSESVLTIQDADFLYSVNDVLESTEFDEILDTITGDTIIYLVDFLSSQLDILIEVEQEALSHSFSSSQAERIVLSSIAVSISSLEYWMFVLESSSHPYHQALMDRITLANGKTMGRFWDAVLTVAAIDVFATLVTATGAPTIAPYVGGGCSALAVLCVIFC